MRLVKRKSLLFPNFIARSVLELNASELSRRGITHLVFDIDETVVPKRHNRLSDEYVIFLKKLEKQGFKILIGSNARRDLTEITRHFNATTVHPSHFSFKPFRHFFRRIIKSADVDKTHIAMVGDRILNDVVGANSAGLTTILVEPYARRQSAFHREYIKFALSG